MTRIEFHSNVSDKISYVCRLTRKARAADCKVVIHSADKATLAALDEALWSFSASDFLPHVMASDSRAPQTPIILADGGVTELPHSEVLINLSSDAPGYFARFERLFEIVSLDQQDKLAARERYRFYQQRGYPLKHEDIADGAVAKP